MSMTQFQAQPHGATLTFIVVALLAFTACNETNETTLAPQNSAQTLNLTALEFGDGWETAWGITSRGNVAPANRAIVDDPTGQLGQVLEVTYPAGSCAFSCSRANGRPLGGTEFRATLNLEPTDHLHLRYWVMFSNEFDFVRGGKLPGLYGGADISGCASGANGFSTRYMWRAQGDGELYAYLADRGGGDCGASLSRGVWRFEPGRWYALEQEVTLNSPGVADGVARVWVDGNLVLERTDLTYRNESMVKIEGLFFSTFFGGSDTSWATPITAEAYFARFAVSGDYIGP